MIFFTTAKKAKDAFLAKSIAGAKREAYRQAMKLELPPELQDEVIELANRIYAIGFSNGATHYFYYAQIKYNEIFKIKKKNKKGF